MIVAIAATAIAMVVGVTWGFVAAFREGWLGELLMRTADMLMAVPVIFLGLVLVAAFGASTWSLILILGLLFAPATARIAGARCSSSCGPTTTSPPSRSGLRPADRASRSCSRTRCPVLIAHARRSILAEAIFVEASLSFVGLGIQPPDTSWGTLLQQGYATSTGRTRIRSSRAS